MAVDDNLFPSEDFIDCLKPKSNSHPWEYVHNSSDKSRADIIFDVACIFQLFQSVKDHAERHLIWVDEEVGGVEEVGEEGIEVVADPEGGELRPWKELLHLRQDQRKVVSVHPVRERGQMPGVELVPHLMQRTGGRQPVRPLERQLHLQLLQEGQLGVEHLLFRSEQKSKEELICPLYVLY